MCGDCTNCGQYGHRTGPKPSPMHCISSESGGKACSFQKKHKVRLKAQFIVSKQQYDHRTWCARDSGGAARSSHHLPDEK